MKTAGVSLLTAKAKTIHRGGQASLGVNSRGGVIVAAGKDRTLNGMPRRLVRLSIEERGGRVEVNGKDGNSRAGIRIDEHGGAVYAWGADEKSASLGITKHGGQVAVSGYQGVPGGDAHCR